MTTRPNTSPTLNAEIPPETATQADWPDAIVVTWDGEHLDALEERLGEWVRLGEQGVQVKIETGIDEDSLGWMPLHAHHTVVLADGNPPFLLPPAAAKFFGLTPTD